jgi:hypothetical protein
VAQILIAASLSLLSLGTLGLVAKVAWAAGRMVEAQVHQQEKLIVELSRIATTIDALRDDQNRFGISIGVLAEKIEGLEGRGEAGD